MVDKNILKQKIIADLKGIYPQKIILFGSFGTDKFIEGESDIDILIIKDTEKKLADRYSEARLSLTLDYSFDIFVLTNKELQDKLSQSFFFREIVKKGEVIYERQ